MKAIDLLVGFGSVKDSYVISVEEFRQGKKEAQIKRLFAIGNKAGFKKDVVEATVKKMFGCEPKDMTKDQYNTVCERLEKKVK